MLQGYSFAKFGARYPSAAGLLEYVSRGFGDGHTTGIIAWLLFAANAIITAMVAVSFGSYAATVVSRGDSAWIKAFAVLVLLAMTILNILGSQAVARAQTVVVYVVIGILTVFAVATLTHIHPHLLAFSRYPSLRDIVSSVALTFFAFLGFGVITFAATSLANPRHDLPRSMFLALGIATVIYVAVALGVFGTLTVQKVISSGGTALAVQPSRCSAVRVPPDDSEAALFATAGATNAGLFPAAGLSEAMAAAGQFPPLLGYRGRAAVVGLLITCGAAIGLSLAFDLTAIASIGSAHRPCGLRPGDGGPPQGPEGDRGSCLAAGAGPRQHRRRPVDFHFHHAGPRTRHCFYPCWGSLSSASRSTSVGSGRATRVLLP